MTSGHNLTTCVQLQTSSIVAGPHSDTVFLYLRGSDWMSRRQTNYGRNCNNPPFSSAICDSERLDNNQLEVSTSPSNQLGLEINQTNNNQNQQEEFHNKLDSNQYRSNNLPTKSSSAQQELPSIVVITDTNEVCDLTHSNKYWAQVSENIQINESNKPH
ncbi:hypothetical protein O181_088834 [Austropuccinia psidii MF-1]|uniref:Uncharacterized protein n=1 Tax=Austropuccinia psidii MF-1 TaxID=1389203 RepID=A0A9Q3ISD6_9BASI|nr:hypothetical protein [Austropuccinia psidii MF-1]